MIAPVISGCAIAFFSIG
ncbi:hypothetical protein ACVQ90_04830 [Staphylococcus aureus]